MSMQTITTWAGRGIGIAAVLLLVASMVATAGAIQADEDRFEPNDHPDNATGLDPGFYGDLSIDGGFDSDRYAIEIEEGDQLHVGLFFDHLEGDLDMRISNPEGVELQRAASVTDDEHLLLTAPETGTYHLLVHGYEGDEGDYDLEVQTGDLSLGPREPDSHSSTATPLLPGSYDGGEIRHAADTDTYESYLEADQTLTASVDFVHADGNLDLLVRDRYDDVVAESRSTSDGESIEFAPDEAGVYFLEVQGVDGATNTYDLEADVEGGVDRSAWISAVNQFGATAPIEDGTLTDQRIGSPSYQTYAIRAAAGERVNATVVESNASAPTVYATSPATNAIEYDGGSVEFEPERDGVYHLGVRSTDPVTFSLRVEGARSWSQDGSGDGGTGDGGEASSDDGSDDGLPGFGVPAALAALLSVAVLVRRH